MGRTNGGRWAILGVAVAVLAMVVLMAAATVGTQVFFGTVYMKARAAAAQLFQTGGTKRTREETGNQQAEVRRRPGSLALPPGL